MNSGPLNELEVRKAVNTLLTAAPPGSTVLLFGSYARGDARPNSDLDFLVIEPLVGERRAEIVRLSDALRAVGMYADILVVSESTFLEWAEEPGTVIYTAAREGKRFCATT